MTGLREFLAGPELDRLVAEHVLGWTRRSHWWMNGESLTGWLNVRKTDAHLRRYDTFAPSTEIESAWEIFQHLRRNLYHVEILVAPGKPTHVMCRIVPLAEPEESALTGVALEAPLAICRAAMALVEKESS